MCWGEIDCRLRESMLDSTNGSWNQYRLWWRDVYLGVCPSWGVSLELESQLICLFGQNINSPTRFPKYHLLYLQRLGSSINICELVCKCWTELGKLKGTNEQGNPNPYFWQLGFAINCQLRLAKVWLCKRKFWQYFSEFNWENYSEKSWFRKLF